MRKHAVRSRGREHESKNEGLIALVKAILADNSMKTLEIIGNEPVLVRAAVTTGASRKAARDYFFPEIRHYLYAGDTALHMAAAGFKPEIAQILIDRGASCAAKNRRGAEPLHYASDCNTRNPAAQVAVIECLIRAGADPNALDKSGVAPIHRAVRTRSAPAVEALLKGGAKPNLPNKSGSTPLHLAVQNTGRGGSGSAGAIEQQRQIIVILLQSGAKTSHKDGSGNTVTQAATTPWIRELLHTQTGGL
jgi:Ankyrin repeats (3 copies)/Ankyrin repeat